MEQDKKLEAQKNLAQVFREMPEREQVAVTTFFNLHNAAIFVYEGVQAGTKEYIDECIRLSQESVELQGTLLDKKLAEQNA